MIHETAVVSRAAKLGNNVSIGPYTIIGDNVRVGDDTRIGSHVIIQGPTVIGVRNRILHFCSLGTDPQDKKYSGESESFLEIGDDNVIREYCSVNRGTLHGGGTTVIGNTNWIMAYTHIAHDCRVGNHTVFANHATLAGHVVIDNHVTLGGFTGVHQYCKVGSYSFTAIASVITKDVPPYTMVSGNPARPRGLNIEGLKRKAFDTETIAKLKTAYRTLYREPGTYNKALQELDQQARTSVEVRKMYEFLLKSERGIVR